MAPVLPMQQTAVQRCSLERPQELCLQRLLAAMGGQQDGGGKGGKGAPPTLPGTGAPPRPPLTGGHSTLTWKFYHSTSLHQACFQFCLGWTACDQGQAQWREQTRTMWYNYRQDEPSPAVNGRDATKDTSCTTDCRPTSTSSTNNNRAAS